VVGEGVKTQTKSRTVGEGVTVRISRVVRRYRLAYAALLSLDPTGDWRNEYLELTDKDNRGPGKELYEKGVGDGHYTMSWIWGGSPGNDQQGTDSPDGDREDVNETVRHEWMTCRARADRWGEELDLLQEEMRRIIAFLEWKSSLWGERVGSRLGSVAADIQHGVDAYARKQVNTYHELAVSLANQWLPHLLALGLGVAWAGTYPWAAEIIHPPSVQEDPLSSNLATAKVAPPSTKQDGSIEPVDFSDDSGDESGDGDHSGAVAGDSIRNEDSGGPVMDSEYEDSDGLVMGYEYDDEYMS